MLFCPIELSDILLNYNMFQKNTDKHSWFANEIEMCYNIRYSTLLEPVHIEIVCGFFYVDRFLKTGLI